jgi:bifunctional DNA-binding transcriptional regulator/antitoxin component of YhaV-PrlF toxin-antitoxin module
MNDLLVYSPINIRIRFGIKPSDYFEIMVIGKDITVYPCGENLQVSVPTNHVMVRNYSQKTTLQESG